MDESADLDRAKAILLRDPAASIMLGAVFLLIVFNMAAIFAVRSHPELLRVSLLLTGAFAVAGIVMGLVRNLRPLFARKG